MFILSGYIRNSTKVVFLKFGSYLQLNKIEYLLSTYTWNLYPLELGWQLLSNYLVIPVVTVFCPKILVTLLTFDTVTGQISESKWKVTSK